MYTRGSRSPVPFLSRENGRQDGNPTDKGLRPSYVTPALISVDVHASRYLWGSVLLAVSVRLGRFWDADMRRSVGDADRWHRRRRRRKGRGTERRQEDYAANYNCSYVAGIIHYRNDCVGSLLRLFRGY